MLPIMLIAAALSYQGCELYQLGHRLRLGIELYRTGKAVGLMLLLLITVTFFIRHPYESRLASLVFAGLTWVGLIGLRRTLGWHIHTARKVGARRDAALIVGTGRLAQGVSQALRSNVWLGIDPVGFVDDESADPNRFAPAALGPIEKLPELVERLEADYVFVALPLERYADVRRVFDLVENDLVEVRLIPDVPQPMATTVDLHYVEGLPIVGVRPGREDYMRDVVKRGMDVFCSAVGLIVLAPLLGVIAAIIKLSDGGPIFYRQERMGLNGRRFMMFKFRSMRVDAESKSGPVWCRQDDDRRTWFGSFLRRSSIDELPQLFNVLIGEMSLVGPRPERPHFISQFRRTIPRYMRRHAVKAGITGWAQVHGWRGNTSLKKRIQYDLYYIAHRSFWLDVRILFLTIFRIIGDRNAY
jgi:exopolysaccharide biosynthesis polyprenyl glycosylphosphotransferase